MKTWYRVACNTIEPVKVVKENAATIVIATKRFSLDGNVPTEWVERRQNKMSQYDCYFPTIQEAIAHLRDQVNIEVSQAKARLRDAETTQSHLNDYLANIEAAIAAKEAIK